MRHFEAGPSFSASRPLWGVDRADESETVSGLFGMDFLLTLQPDILIWWEGLPLGGV